MIKTYDLGGGGFVENLPGLRIGLLRGTSYGTSWSTSFFALRSPATDSQCAGLAANRAIGAAITAHHRDGPPLVGHAV